jgi:hypothetical protein
VRANGLADAMVVQVSDELLHARKGLGLGEQLVLPRPHELQVVLRRDGQLQVLDEMEMKMKKMKMKMMKINTNS